MPRPRPPGPVTCGCERPHYAHGLCERHYDALRRPGRCKPPKSRKNLSGCSEPGCRREYHARGLCQLHYQKMRNAIRSAARPPLPYYRNQLVPQIEELAETMTQAQIAKLLKITRNVVIGVVDRARKLGRLPDPKDGPDQPYVPTREIFPAPGTCLWMEGDPRDQSSHFCGEEVLQRGVYCDTHRSVVYVPVSNSGPPRTHALAAGAAGD